MEETMPLIVKPVMYRVITETTVSPFVFEEQEARRLAQAWRRLTGKVHIAFDTVEYADEEVYTDARYGPARLTLEEFRQLNLKLSKEGGLKAFQKEKKRVTNKMRRQQRKQKSHQTA